MIEEFKLIKVPVKEGFVDCGIISLNENMEARLVALNDFPLDALNEIMHSYSRSLKEQEKQQVKEEK